jgi:CarD family transcriptional regulator
MKTYKAGESVVHLSHGVGVVKGIEEREFTKGKKQSFYIIQIDDIGGPKKIFVPIETSDQRLRPIMTKEDAKRVVEIVTGREKIDYVVNNLTWNRRYREYMERIYTGDPLEVARVASSLKTLKQDHDLSFGERKLLDLAMQRIEAELKAAGVILQ